MVAKNAPAPPAITSVRPVKMVTSMASTKKAARAADRVAQADETIAKTIWPIAIGVAMQPLVTMASMVSQVI